MERLKPCPLCGGDIVTSYVYCDYKFWGMSCKKCGAYTPISDAFMVGTEKCTADIWNSRVE